MRFFVVAPDGQRYGPADLKMLDQWVKEGRILPSHEVEEEGTGRRMRADQVPGLFLGHQTTYQNPPTAGAYIPPSFSMSPIVPSIEADRLTSKAWNMAYLGLAMLFLLGCCTPFAFFGGACGAMGVKYSLDAKKMGSSNAQGAMILCVVVIVLAVIAIWGGRQLFNLSPWRF